MSAVKPSTNSSQQRDLRWLAYATPDQIDRALAQGELDRVLGNGPAAARTQ